jgi:hypothetical protein
MSSTPLLPAAFVSKEEVRHWPVLGWLAARNENDFPAPGEAVGTHASSIRRSQSACLKASMLQYFLRARRPTVARFSIFHAALLQPALAAGKPVFAGGTFLLGS